MEYKHKNEGYVMLITDCIKIINKDIEITSKYHNFLKNLLIQMEIYHGYYMYVRPQKTEQENIIQKIMNFIAKHGRVSMTSLMQEFLMEISEIELDKILGSLRAAGFIQAPVVKKNQIYIQHIPGIETEETEGGK